jgi:hypothetical protein
MEKKKLRVDVDHSNLPFFSDGISVSHNPSKFIVDFVQNTPRFEALPDGKKQESMVIKHNTIIMDPHLAKSFIEVLKSNMKNYEKRFGAIKLRDKKKVKGKGKTAIAHAETRYIG